MNFLKTISLMFVTFVGVAMVASGQSLDSPLAYLGYIGDQSSNISQDQWNYIKATAHGKSARKVEKRRNELLNSINEAKRAIQRMPKYEGDGSLRDSIAYFLHMRYVVFKEDYSKIINLEEIAERSYNDMEAYLLAKEVATQKLASASDNISTKIEAFASENNIKLVSNESKLSKKLRISGEVYEYYNDVYLLFFKAYKADENLLNAIQKEDLNAIEQNKNALLAYADEGLEKLKALSQFKGDRSLAASCQATLDFYKNMTEAKLQTIVDYHLKRERFEKIKTSIEAKKPNQRSQKDIDQYNEAVNDMNQGINEFNDVNKALGDSRARLINDWNKKSNAFLDKHVP